MNFHTFTIYILLFSSVSVFKLVFGTSVYTGSSYNDREAENAPGVSSHQKKRLLNDDPALTRSFREEEQPEESDRASVYETPRYRKYQPSVADPAYHRESRMERQDSRDLSDFEGDERMNMQKREYFDAANNPKDSSIEVILDPRAKKAVAVVENSPSGQAMYDLSGWKNAKEDASSFDDAYAQGNQEQVVNLVYPAERSAEHGVRKYTSENFDPSNSDKSSIEDSHKKKRSTEIYKRSTMDQKSEPEKRSATSDKRKASETQANDLKTDTKQSDCPPHNSPNTVENMSKEKKREATPKWSQDQINALTNSLMRARDNNNEMDNLKSILSEMGLVDNSPMTQKREISSDGSEAETAGSEKMEEGGQKRALESSGSAAAEDEDLNQDSLALKRNDREASTGNKFEVDVNEAPEEPLEKRDLQAEEENSKEEESSQDQESPTLNSVPMETAERSNEEFQNTNAKEETDAAVAEDQSAAAARTKRQNADKKEEDTAAKSNIQPMSENNSDTAKKYTKRDAEDKKEKRKSNEDEEEYEHRIESQIQAKIDAIKEKVKREIMEERKRAKRNASKQFSRQRREATMKSADSQSAKNTAKNIRKKRANNLPEKRMIYQPYQGEQDEENEEDGEFDDNAYDGRMYLEKRQADDDDFQYFNNARQRDMAGYAQQRNRRSFDDTDDADDSAAFHGGGMVMNRRAALKNKSFNEREKRGNTFTAEEEEKADENENMENSDNEYFGSLPQTYNGELTRYKRVKRDNPYK